MAIPAKKGGRTIWTAYPMRSTFATTGRLPLARTAGTSARNRRSEPSAQRSRWRPSAAKVAVGASQTTRSAAQATGIPRTARRVARSRSSVRLPAGQPPAAFRADGVTTIPLPRNSPYPPTAARARSWNPSRVCSAACAAARRPASACRTRRRAVRAGVPTATQAAARRRKSGSRRASASRTTIAAPHRSDAGTAARAAPLPSGRAPGGRGTMRKQVPSPARSAAATATVEVRSVERSSMTVTVNFGQPSGSRWSWAPRSRSNAGSALASSRAGITTSTRGRRAASGGGAGQRAAAGSSRAARRDAPTMIVQRTNPRPDAVKVALRAPAPVARSPPSNPTPSIPAAAMRHGIGVASVDAGSRCGSSGTKASPGRHAVGCSHGRGRPGADMSISKILPLA